MAEDQGPSLTDTILDKIPGGSYVKSFLGFMSKHPGVTDPLEAMGTAALIDQIGDTGPLGKVAGAGAALALEKGFGMNKWMAGLLGGAVGKMADTMFGEKGGFFGSLEEGGAALALLFAVVLAAKFLGPALMKAFSGMGQHPGLEAPAG